MFKKIVSVTISILLLAIWIVSIMVLAQPSSVFAANIAIVGDKSGISIFPDGPLFTMENIAPGDTESSTLVIKNSGDKAFSCFIKAEKENGDEALFRDLDITIENNDSSYEYYSGSLNKLKDVELGSVPSASEKSLNLRIHFPENIGNELQGKSLAVKFIFTAKAENEEPGTSPTPIPGETQGPEETPNPGTTPETSPVPTSEPDLEQGTTPEPTENIIEIEEEETPAGPVATSPEPTTDTDEEVVIEDEKIPQGLPKTGGIAAEIFYLAGLILIVVGLKIRRGFSQ